MIREAREQDKTMISTLHYLAAKHFLVYFFASPEALILKMLDRLYETTDTFFSGEYWWVHEEQGAVQGGISVFPGKDKKMLERNIRNYGNKLMRLAGVMTMLKMGVRGIMSPPFPPIHEDELYIQALAVLPEYRGQRIASGLLRAAFAQAEQLHLSKVSLLVELPNAHAIAIYQKYGFHITATQHFPRRYQKYDLYGLHKMVADVDNKGETT